MAPRPSRHPPPATRHSHARSLAVHPCSPLDAAIDLCPDDASKLHPGACGCGVSDADLNGNAVPDCFDAAIDLCPDDASKLHPGACGCGVSDADLNGNGVPDCFDTGIDLCPDDPVKTQPGTCGCGVSDADTNGNGVPDSFEGPFCGDGTVDPDEPCDDGPANSDTTPDACRTDCTRARCGDGARDTGEECDGSDLGGATCASLGLPIPEGPLTCDSGCRLDGTACGGCSYGNCYLATVCRLGACRQPLCTTTLDCPSPLVCMIGRCTSI